MTHCVVDIDGQLVVIGARYGIEPVRDNAVAYVGGEPLVEVDLEVGDFEDLGEQHDSDLRT